MSSTNENRTNPRFQVTLDRRTVRIVERVRKTVLGSGSRSAAIRYLAAYFEDMSKRRCGDTAQR
jgi:hypothetical protein